MQTILIAIFVKNPNNLKKDNFHEFEKFQQAPLSKGDDIEVSENNYYNKELENNYNSSYSDLSKNEEKKSAEPEEFSQKSPDSPKEYESSQSETNKSDSKDQNKGELAYYIFSFLKQKNLNITLVGYFCRVLNHLIIRKQTDVIFFD